MKTLILCGGLGTRLKEETEFRPKPMVYVGGQPLITHIMQIYAHYGHREFILALGYKAEFIKQFFLKESVNMETDSIEYHLPDGNNQPIKITFVDTGLETLPGERILGCAQYLNPQEDFMVTYGDGLSDVPIDQLITYHQRSQRIGTLTGVHPRSKYGLIEVGSRGLITHFQEKPILTDWINGGFMVFKPEFLEYLRKGENEHAAFIRLVAKQQLGMYKHAGFWFAVDTFKELEDLKAIWNSGKPSWKVWA